MLIPQFSLRWLLAVVTVAAGVFSVVGLGVRGNLWAAAVTIGMASLVLLMAVCAMLFVLVWVVAALMGGAARRGRSPFRPLPVGVGFPSGTIGPPPQAPIGPPRQEAAAGPVASEEVVLEEVLLDEEAEPPQDPAKPS